MLVGAIIYEAKMHGNITTYYCRGIRTNFRRHGREYRIPETTSYPPVTWPPRLDQIEGHHNQENPLFCSSFAEL